MHVPNNKNIIFLFDSREREFKTSNSNSWNFPNRIDTMNLRLFLWKVYHMLITINMKSDIAFVAINNSPCSIQKRSTKDDRHIVVLGNIKNKKYVKIVTFATTTGTSSQIPMGIAVDLSAICEEISVGVNLFKSNLRYKERGITLTPAPIKQF